MSKFILTMHIDLLDEHTNEEVLALVTKLEERLSQVDMGRFVGSGGGMNQIDLTYLVQDEEQAKVLMDESLRSLELRETHTFIAEVFTGDEANYFDDVEGLSLSKLSYFFGLIFFLILSLIYVAWSLVAEIRK